MTNPSQGANFAEEGDEMPQQSEDLRPLMIRIVELIAEEQKRIPVDSKFIAEAIDRIEHGEEEITPEELCAGPHPSGPYPSPEKIYEIAVRLENKGKLKN